MRWPIPFSIAIIVIATLLEKSSSTLAAFAHIELSNNVAPGESAG